jgi:hypothetical protein
VEWNFNAFQLEAVSDSVKELGLKLAASEQRQVFNAVTWRDESAAKVVKKAHKLKGEKLAALLASLGTTEAHLADFGYWPTEQAGVWIEYDTDSELRDTESIPLNYGRAPEERRRLSGGRRRSMTTFCRRCGPMWGMRGLRWIRRRLAMRLTSTSISISTSR